MLHGEKFLSVEVLVDPWTIVTEIPRQLMKLKQTIQTITAGRGEGIGRKLHFKIGTELHGSMTTNKRRITSIRII